jgi:hypothetical protein
VHQHADDPVAWPTVQAGDVAFCGGSCRTRHPDDPSGWTVPTNGSFDNSTSGSANSRFYHRVCDGSETGNITLSISGTAATRVGEPRRLSRRRPTPRPSTSCERRNESVSGTTHACPSVTTGAANCVITVDRRTVFHWHERLDAAVGYNERADTTTLATAGGRTITATADDGLASPLRRNRGHTAGVDVRKRVQ